MKKILKGDVSLSFQQWMTFIFSWKFVEQYVLLPLGIFSVTLTIGFFLNQWLKKFLLRHESTTNTNIFLIFLNGLKGLPVLWSFAIGIYCSISTMALPASIEKFLSWILFTVMVFTLTRILVRTIDQVIDIYLAKTNQNETSLLTNLVNVLIYFVGVIIILGHYGISIAPLITAMGIGGMALALGLQEMLANIFAGLHLIFSKQIQIGDFIRLASGDEGQVTDITWRYTTIQTTLDNTMIVPNKSIAAATILNYDKPTHLVALVVPLGVDYSSDLKLVETETIAVAKIILQEIEGSIEKDPVIRFNSFGDSAIQFNAILYVQNFLNQGKIRHEFIKKITERYRELSINIPFPVRTILQGK